MLQFNDSSRHSLDVVRLFQSILPGAVLVRGGQVNVPMAPLFPVEQQAMRSAGSKRRLEFTAGRHYARAALQALGGEFSPIAVSFDRCPIWPGGIVGSITHTDHYAAAALAKSNDFQAIGIDLENSVPLTSQMINLITTETERQTWTKQAWRPELRNEFALLTFSAKESVFKAYYPLCRKMLRFNDIQIHYSSHDRFTISTTRILEDDPLLQTIEGRFVATEHFVATSALLST
jgi:4'-phosphopantetheinyl transferase EntD